MERLLLFSSLTPTAALLKRWNNFACTIRGRHGYQVGFLSSADPKSIDQISFRDFSSVHLTGSGTDLLEPLRDDEILLLIDRYRDIKFGQIRLLFKEKTAYAESDLKRLDTIILRYAMFFESLLITNQYDVVVTRLIDAEASHLLPILSGVCRYLKIPALNISHGALRIFIGDSDNGSSTVLEKVYIANKNRGLTQKELDKVKEAIKAYKNVKRSDAFRSYIYKESDNRVALHKKLFRRLFLSLFGKDKQQISHASLYSRLNVEKTSYVLLVLNKQANWRVNFFSPYFSDAASLVRNIAMSLPLTHSLVVKDHPHTANRWDLINHALVDECSRLPNVHYIDPKLDTLGIIENADVVFSVGSFSGVDSLFCLKHLIVFGNAPFFFGSTDAPVIRMKNWDDLSEIVDYCLDTEPNVSNILTYLFSFFQVTTSRSGVGQSDDWTDFAMDIDHHVFQAKVASFIGGYLESEF